MEHAKTKSEILIAMATKHGLEVKTLTLCESPTPDEFYKVEAEKEDMRRLAHLGLPYC